LRRRQGHRTLQALKIYHQGQERRHHQARNAPSTADKHLHRHQPPEKNRLPARSALEDAKVRYSPTGLGGRPSKTGATQDAASELLRIYLPRTLVNRGKKRSRSQVD
jgi:hypothetical protein